ncbi:hypothetical protein [Arsenicicoccus dermatophilus]|nr:hypothetical protein [Arsenicicoccus dermatophilus]
MTPNEDGTTPLPHCDEHDADAVYDMDCWRCPMDNAVVKVAR